MASVGILTIWDDDDGSLDAVNVGESSSSIARACCCGSDDESRVGRRSTNFEAVCIQSRRVCWMEIISSLLFDGANDSAAGNDDVDVFFLLQQTMTITLFPPPATAGLSCDAVNAMGGMLTNPDTVAKMRNKIIDIDDNVIEGKIIINRRCII